MTRRTRATGRDRTERLASSVARKLRSALGAPAGGDQSLRVRDLGVLVQANEHASGYGTVCVTGRPILERLWMHCVDGEYDLAIGRLLESERDAGARRRDWDPLSAVFFRLASCARRSPSRRAQAVRVVTRLWVLDELRWFAQRDADDQPRKPLDTMLSKLNHGDQAVVVDLAGFIGVVRGVVESWA